MGCGQPIFQSFTLGKKIARTKKDLFEVGISEVLCPATTAGKPATLKQVIQKPPKTSGIRYPPSKRSLQI